MGGKRDAPPSLFCHAERVRSIVGNPGSPNDLYPLPYLHPFPTPDAPPPHRTVPHREAKASVRFPSVIANPKSEGEGRYRRRRRRTQRGRRRLQGVHTGPGLPGRAVLRFERTKELQGKIGHNFWRGTVWAILLIMNTPGWWRGKEPVHKGQGKGEENRVVNYTKCVDGLRPALR